MNAELWLAEIKMLKTWEIFVDIFFLLFRWEKNLLVQQPRLVSYPTTMISSWKKATQTIFKKKKQSKVYNVKNLIKSCDRKKFN